MNYIPLNQNIIVERIAGEKVTTSGILLRTSEEVDTAKVIAVSVDVNDVKVGDRLLVNWNGSVKLEREIYKMNIDNVIAVFEY